MAAPPHDAFDRTLVEPLRRQTTLLVALALCGNVTLSLVEDLLAFAPGPFAVRAGSTAAFAVLLLTFRRDRSARAVVGFGWAVHLLLMLEACALVPLTGGWTSHIFPAIYVICMLPPLFFGYRPSHALALQVVLFAPAAALSVSMGGDLDLSVSRVLLLALIGAGSFAAGRQSYRMRRRDFEAAEALRKADEELRGTQAQLIQAEKLTALGTLSACMAHELNQPLTVLLGYTALLRSGLQTFSGSVEDREALLRQGEMIRHGAERLSELVNRLRVYSRRSERQSVPVSLNDAVRGALLFIEPELRDRGTRLVLELGEPSPLVSGDATELEQVVLNLLTNARDALQGQNDGRITIRTSANEGSAMLEVEDNGPGVPDGVREEIFVPFVTTKPAGQGTGLGLAVSQLIVRRHGGQIELCESPSRGARFRITFPLAVVEGAPSDGSAGPEPTSDPALRDAGSMP